ncbi:MAG: hypothetical protein Q8S21_04575 [Candidatus Paracaedibacteraceae bacterium]|nr:hypothetical protein [Candidatus Paracaedibacteraceae bacterium]
MVLQKKTLGSFPSVESSDRKVDSSKARGELAKSSLQKGAPTANNSKRSPAIQYDAASMRTPKKLSANESGSTSQESLSSSNLLVTPGPTKNRQPGSSFAKKSASSAEQSSINSSKKAWKITGGSMSPEKSTVAEKIGAKEGNGDGKVAKKLDFK